MLGGADNPNGELLSYIIGADIVSSSSRLPGQPGHFPEERSSFCRPGLRVFPRSGPFRRGTLTTSRGSCPGADAKVFDASGKKFCGWYISPLDD